MFKRLYKSLEDHASNVAFCIDDNFYTYGELSAVVANIRTLIRENISRNEQITALVAHNDVETYASILALWFEGKAYLPLLPSNPQKRNENILRQANIKYALSSSAEENMENICFLHTKNISDNPVTEQPKDISDTAFAYILFTSGSTAVPKGVPVSRGNISAFVHAFDALDSGMTSRDKCLQMFDLTFDMSIIAFLTALLHGAAVYTLPPVKAKYAYAIKLMHENELTVAVMVPSVINYLSSYFDQIYCPAMRYNLFAGEALMKDTLIGWKKCIPNARIDNAYGPTETCIICSYYTIPSPPQQALSHNGLLSIGKPMKGTEMIIADENGQALPAESKGEVCISGKQVFSGYFKDEEKNKTVFFKRDNITCYRSGDMAFSNEEGYFFFLGRKDFQIKIDGYRIDLLEIEHHIRTITDNRYLVSVVSFAGNTNHGIGVAIKSEPFDTKELMEQLKLLLPKYMIPSRFVFLPEMPLNNNGKIDKQALQSLLETCRNK
ncbi:MAG: AMP-binding protein [Bacteroidales bacterium]|jgi:amino acid adenylation domain-containing protein|nr:AMP-binding protein [Bacteroidales bacterium]